MQSLQQDANTSSQQETSVSGRAAPSTMSRDEREQNHRDAKIGVQADQAPPELEPLLTRRRVSTKKEKVKRGQVGNTIANIVAVRTMRFNISASLPLTLRTCHTAPPAAVPLSSSSCASASVCQAPHLVIATRAPGRGQSRRGRCASSAGLSRAPSQSPSWTCRCARGGIASVPC
jgi:hypothetical protein